MNVTPLPASVFARKLVQLVARHGRGALVAASVMGMISGLASAGSIAVIYQSLRGGATPGPWPFALFVALCLLVPLSRMVSQYLLLQRSLESMMQLVLELIGRAFATPLRQLEEIGATRLLTALTRDVVMLTDTVSAVPNVILQGTILIGCTVYLARLHLAAAALFVAIMVLATWGTLAAVRRSQVIQWRTRADADELFAHFRAHVSGIKELQLHLGRQADFFAGLRTTGESYRRNHTAGEMAYTISTSWFQLVFMVPIGLVALVIAPMFHIPPAEVGAYTLVLLYMNGPIAAISSLVQTFSRGALALGNIEALGLALQPARSMEEITRSAAPRASVRPWRRIELRGVTHTYAGDDGSRFTLGPLSITFPRGEIVVITGGNGSGKTTLAKLLCGLYPPDTGSVAVDGVPVSDASREDYRQRISAVFADFHLFDRLLGLDGPDLELTVRTQLEALQLHHRVDVRDGVFTTLQLSQGQRKRLALLVTRLEDRDILLFDEWAADQDQEFREYFYRRLLPELRDGGRTVFVISHDERYFDMADRLLKLEVGQIVSDIRLRAPEPAVT